MKKTVYKVTLAFIIVAGVVIGIVKGQEVRQKWLSKMKNKHETKTYQGEVMLDEIEMSTYHAEI